MGFLLELLFEGIFELILYSYIKLMQLIIPKKTVSQKARKIIKIIVSGFSTILIFTIIIGIALFTEEDPYIQNLGKYMTFIPLAIIAVQILLGIFVRILRHFKK